MVLSVTSEQGVCGRAQNEDQSRDGLRCSFLPASTLSTWALHRDGLTGAAPDDTPPWRTLLQSNYLHSVPVGCSERAVCWLLCRLAACRVVPLLLLTPDGPGPLGAL